MTPHQSDATAQALRIVVPILILALGALNGWMAFILSSMNSRYDSMETTVNRALVSHATYQERVDRLQEAQTLTANLVSRLQEEVSRQRQDIDNIKRGN